MTRAGAVAFAMGLVGCGPEVADGPPHTWVQQSQGVFLQFQYRLDVLLVIDDSPTMTGDQQSVATAAATFARMFEQQSPDRHYYRFGVTTTSVTQPGCDGPTAVDGALLTESCREHLEDFVVGQQDEIDDRSVCLEHCPLEHVNLDPSVVYPRREATDNPWIDNTTDNATLPDDIAGADALACVATRGSAGCEHPAPLEAMRLALARMEDPSDPAFGFRRSGAGFMVVFITNGHECSFTEAAAALIGPDTPQAVCWTAGVRCDGGPGRYDDCYPRDIDVDGMLTSPESAVLTPLSTYIDVLQRVEDEKQAAQPSAEVLVATIAGFGTDGSVTYQDALDEALHAEFGIGPGCAAGSARSAMPPARLAAFTDAFSYRGHGPSRHNFCSSDWRPALAPVFHTLGIPQRYCVDLCVADQDPTTPKLDTDCVVRVSSWNDAGPFTDVIAACERDAGEPSLPEGENACWHLKTGDEVPDYCADDGSLQLGYLRRPDTFIPHGFVEIECLVSPNPARDCPELER
ncbi:MAG: hypothetical protein JKY37_12315 [Nannocystaceae bacterium]|nr:hypothetical protein [Nannocystaceae bacterium]